MGTGERRDHRFREVIQEEEVLESLCALVADIRKSYESKFRKEYTDSNEQATALANANAACVALDKVEREFRNLHEQETPGQT